MFGAFLLPLLPRKKKITIIFDYYKIMAKKYNHQKIEKKWQSFWQKNNTFKTPKTPKNKKLYILDMFPYPSAYGLHVGHMRGYTYTDLLAKKRRMEGYSVLHPMGWDAFGLPAENFAIKTGIHPKTTTEKNIKNIKRQLIQAGYDYDWQKELNTSQKNYYRWTQWLFLKLFENGLAYKKEAPVNWCPSCKTVLANEQVVNGKCERCGTPVQQKKLSQWFIKITKYADRLLKDLKDLDWPENIKEMQKNWIGKSQGTKIKFEILPLKEKIEVFTTRADTVFGATYLVIAPEHKIIEKAKGQIKNIKAVNNYIRKAIHKTALERQSLEKAKTGIELKGLKAINPATKKQIPIFVADYVLPTYGTGAIMAVPAHDQRDFDFAKKFNLPIIQVVKSKQKIKLPKNKAFEEYGILINSGQFSGLSSEKAKKEITKWLGKKGLAKASTQYKLRDWLVSRQRYWGVPIPIIYCPEHGPVAVPEKDLPVVLPNIKDFLPTGDGKSPLAKSKKFVETKCPICGKKAHRETDTLDTFVDSSWYYLRYPDNKNSRQIFDKAKIKKWLPVNIYIGGAEHAVLHLLYSRFITKFLYDLGYVDFKEPFLKLYNPGLIYRYGAKMSKSKGNVVNPDEFIKQYGADTMRLYELFLGPANQAIEWNDKGVIGIYRFLNKVWSLQDKVSKAPESKQIESSLHKTIKSVSEDIEVFKFNTAISSLMILANNLFQQKQINKKTFETFLKLLSPMAPHIAEELWQVLGNKKSIFKQKWPSYNKKLAEQKTFNLIVQINGKTRLIMTLEVGASQSQVEKIVLKENKIKKYIPSQQKIKKIIFVKDKLINFIV